MLTTLLAAMMIAQATPPRMVEALPFDPATIAAKPRETIRVAEEGRAVAYEGVPLASFLPPKPAGATAMGAIKGLSDAVIVVRGSDGYQVAVSAAEVAMDPKGERYLLALARDGKPLAEGHGPAQLIVPGDPMRVRWCRGIVSARLVRVGTLVETP